jgi:Outer membrane protein beta-barrel domain
MRYLLALLFIFPLSLTAQKAFRAGVTIGNSGCQIHGDNDWGYRKNGFVAGIFVCTDPSKKWYGQMEIQYSAKGSRKYANPDKGDYNSFRFRLNYVEVPFLIRLNSGKFHFEIGETFGVLVNARQWDTFGEITPLAFRQWETASVFGLGYSFNSNWIVDFRTVNSVLPVLKFPLPVNYNRFIPNLFNRGMYNNILTLSLSYRIGAKKSSE